MSTGNIKRDQCSNSMEYSNLEHAPSSVEGMQEIGDFFTRVTNNAKQIESCFGMDSAAAKQKKLAEIQKAQNHVRLSPLFKFLPDAEKTALLTATEEQIQHPQVQSPPISNHEVYEIHRDLFVEALKRDAKDPRTYAIRGAGIGIGALITSVCPIAGAALFVGGSGYWIYSALQRRFEDARLVEEGQRTRDISLAFKGGQLWADGASSDVFDAGVAVTFVGMAKFLPKLAPAKYMKFIPESLLPRTTPSEAVISPKGTPFEVIDSTRSTPIEVVDLSNSPQGNPTPNSETPFVMKPPVSPTSGSPANGTSTGLAMETAPNSEFVVSPARTTPSSEVLSVESVGYDIAPPRPANNATPPNSNPQLLPNLPFFVAKTGKEKNKEIEAPSGIPSNENHLPGESHLPMQSPSLPGVHPMELSAKKKQEPIGDPIAGLPFVGDPDDFQKDKNPLKDLSETDLEKLRKGESIRKSHLGEDRETIQTVFTPRKDENGKISDVLITRERDGLLGSRVIKTATYGSPKTKENRITQGRIPAESVSREVPATEATSPVQGDIGMFATEYPAYLYNRDGLDPILINLSTGKRSVEGGLPGHSWSIELEYVPASEGRRSLELRVISGEVEFQGSYEVEGRKISPNETVPLNQADRLKLGGVRWEFGIPTPDFYSNYLLQLAEFNGDLNYFSQPYQQDRLNFLTHSPFIKNRGEAEKWQDEAQIFSKKFGEWDLEKKEWKSGWAKEFQDYQMEMDRNADKLSTDPEYSQQMDAKWRGIVKKWEGVTSTWFYNMEGKYREVLKMIDFDLRSFNGFLMDKEGRIHRERTEVNDDYDLYKKENNSSSFKYQSYRVDPVEEWGEVEIEQFRLRRGVVDHIQQRIGVSHWTEATEYLKELEAAGFKINGVNEKKREATVVIQGKSGGHGQEGPKYFVKLSFDVKSKGPEIDSSESLNTSLPSQVSSSHHVVIHEKGKQIHAFIRLASEKTSSRNGSSKRVWEIISVSKDGNSITLAENGRNPNPKVVEVMGSNSLPDSYKIIGLQVHLTKPLEPMLRSEQGIVGGGWGSVLTKIPAIEAINKGIKNAPHDKTSSAPSPELNPEQRKKKIDRDLRDINELGYIEQNNPATSELIASSGKTLAWRLLGQGKDTGSASSIFQSNENLAITLEYARYKTAHPLMKSYVESQKHIFVKTREMLPYLRNRIPTENPRDTGLWTYEDAPTELKSEVDNLTQENQRLQSELRKFQPFDLQEEAQLLLDEKNARFPAAYIINLDRQIGELLGVYSSHVRLMSDPRLNRPAIEAEMQEIDANTSELQKKREAFLQDPNKSWKEKLEKRIEILKRVLQKYSSDPVVNAQGDLDAVIWAQTELERQTKDLSYQMSSETRGKVATVVQWAKSVEQNQKPPFDLLSLLDTKLWGDQVRAEEIEKSVSRGDETQGKAK